MLFIFRAPWGARETNEAIKSTITSLKGKVKEKSPGCFIGKWKINPDRWGDFSYKATFYVGEDMVRAIINADFEPSRIKRTYHMGKELRFWNTFVEGLLARYPGVEFGLAPGEPAVSEVKLHGDGTKQVFTSTTTNSPSIGGALVGGMLFGTAGAIIGASGGKSHTEGYSSTEFSYTVPATVRYTNGLIMEGYLVRDSSLYHEIMVNMSQLSGL
jgi:hypothetical protein